MKVVVALGGNALGIELNEQLKNVRKTTEIIASLLSDRENDIKIILTHGNGPQVGLIKLAFENGGINMPLAECCAMSQGYIGYHLQSALNESFDSHALRYSAQALVSRVVVDKDDSAFLNPTKPIGAFYSYEEAKKIMLENPGIIMKEDSGRGYRRVVASPKPIDILESASIEELIQRDNVVITCGGGGIPVYDYDGRKMSVECIIDKDLTASLLARKLDADVLCILTEVENVYLNYNKPNQQILGDVFVGEMERYIEEGHFANGSMLPKVMAAVEFVKSGNNKRAVITSLENFAPAIKGNGGTSIYKDKKATLKYLQPVM